MQNLKTTSTQSRTTHWLLIGALLAGSLFCFFMAGSGDAVVSEPVTPSAVTDVALASTATPSSWKTSLQPIQTIRVGQRVWLEDSPDGETDNRFGEEVIGADWRKMVLQSPKTSGDYAKVEMIRPLWWLEERDVHAGGQVDIEVPECGIKGLADVLAVEPCPAIDGGPGRTVTATFHHQSSSVIDIQIEGLDEPIGTTANHPFWSETKQEFVRANELELGEHVRTHTDDEIGIAKVLGTSPRGSPEPVFNLEVHVSHVYCVAKTRVLVHNGGLKVTNACDAGRDLAPNSVDKWSRGAKSLQDKLTLDAAKAGKGQKLIDNLGDPKFKGMEKWEYKVKSANGRDSVVHYVRDPKTGKLMDFKFKKHSTDTPGIWERTPDPPIVSPQDYIGN